MVMKAKVGKATVIAFLLMMFIAGVLVLASQAMAKPAPLIEKKLAEKLEKLSNEELVDVIVIFDDGKIPSAKQLKARLTAIKEKRPMFEKLLKATGFKVEGYFNASLAFHGKIPKKYFNRLEKLPYVKAVMRSYLDKDELVPVLDQVIPRIGANKVWQLTINGTPIRGAGVAVCVLDSGIDYTHPAFGSCTTEQVVSGTCPRVGGYDFGMMDDDPREPSVIAHGTHVAGILGSEASPYTGVAPEVKILALKDYNESSGRFRAWMWAMDWCLTHKDDYNIVAFTASLGWDGFYDDEMDCLYASHPDIQLYFPQMYDAGILITVAAGNEFDPNNPRPGVIYPACEPQAVAVGGVDDNDNLIYNRGRFLEIVAPATNIMSACNSIFSMGCLEGGYISASGTSMSTPQVAGAAALLQQFAQLVYGQKFTADEVRDILKHSGKTVHDPYFGYDYPQLDVWNSLIYAAPAYNLTLRQGWNLISLPLSPVFDASVQFLLHDCIDDGVSFANNIYRYTGSGYEIYPADFGELAVGEGYWIYASKNCTATLKGVPPRLQGENVVSLNPGWNLIGYPDEQEQLWANVKVSNGTLTLSVEQAVQEGWLSQIAYYYEPGYGYRATSVEGGDDAYMRPGRAYWIYANMPVDLIF